MALPLLGLLSSCATSRYYNQRTMFQLTKGRDGVVDTARLRRAVNRTARNYTIHPNDLLNIQVYTNKGEKLIDPNGELRFGTGIGSAGSAIATGASTSGRGGGGGGSAVPGSTQYVVQADGTVHLPLVDRVYLQGLSLIQADSVLKIRYSAYYKEPFIKTAVSNNRVIILGAPGGLVINLANDNMNLLEVLALAGGPDGGAAGGSTGIARNGGRIDNIRIIRGDLKNPQVQFINLNTLEGMRRGNLQVEPNDIIYIQPVRRPLLDNLNDATPVLSLASTLLGLTSIAFSLINYLR
ncbi:polysaccharide biosynthesis/export family protein [Hymenobacter cheonanensis]|uniref:polysaccharide biosynthesis/export family protein n=1 Tax=Hymenobacter sp. CA2-7 TaxID=3063993 RepID=UPI002713FF22|nr:polysaccharide biosynthesis/export family protein [Hymenobacter sp. CA2-7]MDO7885026.1 polysaccharide biosynthesis/export family protein [Hymenobacter sp. CA2-7]